MDRDGDGEISEKELRRFVKHNGLELELFEDVFDKVLFSTSVLSLSLFSHTSLTHSLILSSHTLPITCTCCHEKSKELKTKIYSHAHSLILSLLTITVLVVMM